MSFDIFSTWLEEDLRAFDEGFSYREKLPDGWKQIKDELPLPGQEVATFRRTYPKHYWVGKWVHGQQLQDEPDEYWRGLPNE